MDRGFFGKYLEVHCDVENVVEMAKNQLVLLLRSAQTDVLPRDAVLGAIARQLQSVVAFSIRDCKDCDMTFAAIFRADGSSMSLVSLIPDEITTNGYVRHVPKFCGLNFEFSRGFYSFDVHSKDAKFTAEEYALSIEVVAEYFKSFRGTNSTSKWCIYRTDDDNDSYERCLAFASANDLLVSELKHLRFVESWIHCKMRHLQRPIFRELLKQNLAGILCVDDEILEDDETMQLTRLLGVEVIIVPKKL